MKTLAIVVLLALALAIYGCSTTSIQNPNQIITDVSSTNWEAQLIGGSPGATGLNFVTEFAVTNTTGQNTAALQINGFSFINDQQCFTTKQGVLAAQQAGTATLNTDSTGEVSGSLAYTVTSIGTAGEGAGSVLSLTTDAVNNLPAGGVSGTSSGTSTSSGTLSHGVVWGNWSLSGPCASQITPAPAGTFIMCQGVASCSIP
jgi:hypothetical protein